MSASNKDTEIFNKNIQIIYQTDTPITSFQFIDVLNKSGLGERRPVDSPFVIKTMLDNADLTITAWVDKPHTEKVNDTEAEQQLIGVARCVTDFSYCCYLSDLAVDKDYQNQGIGKQMIEQIEAQLPPTCKLILLASPDAMAYYPKIGFTKLDNAWVKKQ